MRKLEAERIPREATEAFQLLPCPIKMLAFFEIPAADERLRWMAGIAPLRQLIRASDTSLVESSSILLARTGLKAKSPYASRIEPNRCDWTQSSRLDKRRWAKWSVRRSPDFWARCRRYPMYEMFFVQRMEVIWYHFYERCSSWPMPQLGVGILPPTPTRTVCRNASVFGISGLWTTCDAQRSEKEFLINTDDEWVDTEYGG